MIIVDTAQAIASFPSRVFTFISEGEQLAQQPRPSYKCSRWTGPRPSNTINLGELKCTDSISERKELLNQPTSTKALSLAS